jgi:hypothetical protein
VAGSYGSAALAVFRVASPLSQTGGNRLKLLKRSLAAPYGFQLTLGGGARFIALGKSLDQIIVAQVALGGEAWSPLRTYLLPFAIGLSIPFLGSSAGAQAREDLLNHELDQQQG